MHRSILVIFAFAACTFSVSTAIALPEFGQPRPVSEVEYGPNGTNTYQSFVTSNGTQRLVLWTNRIGTLFGIRVGSDGALLEDEPFVVGTGWFGRIVAVSNGEDFLVVWNERSNHAPDRIRSVLVSDGEVQGQPIELSSGSRIATHPGVAWNGSHFLVTWAESDEGSALEDIIGYKLDRSGQPLGNPRFTIWESTYSSGEPDVASNGDGFLVVWEGDSGRNGIDAARVSGDWQVLDAQPVTLPTDTLYPRQPSVGSDGTDYLVVWGSGSNETRNIAGVRVDAATGESRDADPIRISEAASDERYPDVGFDGARYVIVWQNDGDNRDSRLTYVAHVDPQGAVTPIDGRQLSSRQAGASPSPAIADERDGAYAAWIETRFDGNSQHHGVYGSRLRQDGTIVESQPTFLSPMASQQYSPAVAASDDTFLVVWLEPAVDTTFTGPDLRGMRFTFDGSPLDPAPFEICRGDENQLSPSVASNGDDFVVTWTESRNNAFSLHATQIRGDTGEVITPCGVEMEDRIRSSLSEVASNGSGYFVTWVDQDPPFTEARPSIYGGLIETAPDRPLEFGQRVRISQSEGEQDLPDIASNGVGYLVAWEQLAGPPNYSDIYVARVSRDGDVLDMGGFPAVDRPDSQEAPAVSSDGQNYLVLWHDSHEVDHADIHAVRIGSDGALLDTGSIRLSDARRGDYEPAATFDGENYVVMWSRNALGLATGNIVALALRPDGELVDTLGGTEMELGRHPTLATTTGGMSLAAWSANNRELGLIPRVVVSPFGVDTDGDGLSDVVDDDPNNPREEEEPEDECDVGSCADAGSNMAPDTVDSTDVDVWQTGDGSDRGCNCTSSEGSLPWGSMVVVAVFLAAARLFQRRR